MTSCNIGPPLCLIVRVGWTLHLRDIIYEWSLNGQLDTNNDINMDNYTSHINLQALNQCR